MRKLDTIPGVILIVSVFSFLGCMICGLLLRKHFRRDANAVISSAAANAIPEAEVVVTPLLPVVYVEAPPV